MKRLALFVFLVGVAPCLVFATDGRTPIYTSSTISTGGYYYLTANLTGGVTIDSNNVTLDLAGHYLVGGSVAIGTGGTARSNVTVKNGRIISGNVSAPNGGKNLTIDDIVIEGGYIDISNAVSAPENIVVENCRASSISLTQAKGGRVAYNQLDIPTTGNGLIYLNQCYAVDVLHNIVRNSGAYGIRLLQSHDCDISYNTVQDVRNGGAIDFEQSNGCVISHNELSGNWSSVYISNSNGANQVLYNNCSHNTGFGILLNGGNSGAACNGNDISFNTCSYNASHGINLNAYSGYNRITNNICSGNTGSAHGIYVSTVAASGRNSIDWNTCSGNAGSGIKLESATAGNVYSHNRCIGNTGANYSDLGTNTSVLYSVGNPTNY
jgi:parallel beta-helix repeat protein